MRVLVVDDHEELAETVTTGLRHEGMVVLELLLAARGAVLSPEELLARAWDEAADPFSNVVKVTISRLRRKLGDPPMIETLPGAGYRI